MRKSAGQNKTKFRNSQMSKNAAISNGISTNVKKWGKFKLKFHKCQKVRNFQKVSKNAVNSN